MSYTNQTTHYGLPLPTQTDLVNGLDNNDAFERIDTAIYGAEQAANTATEDIVGIRATIAQLQNADVTFQSELTGVKARVSTLEENETTVLEDIQDTQDMITAREVPTAQSDQRILVGEWFRYNGVLYVCTVQIEIGDTIVPNVNCRATNVESEIGGSANSHVGQVIFSTTLDTEAKVIALYGGVTWSQIEGRFILGSSSDYAVGSIGGEAEHILTIAEMPEHTHPNSTMRNDTQQYIQSGSGNWLGLTGPTGSAGGGQAHNNMPPYFATYIWVRTA